MTANKMPEMPECRYPLVHLGSVISDVFPRRQVEQLHADWTAYTADQMRAMYLAGLEAALGELPARVHGENEWVEGFNACRETTLTNLTALEQEAKK